MNRLDIIGRLTKDVEVRTRQDGKTYGMLTVAVNRGFGKEKNEADFFTCFMNNVENVAPYLIKGTLVGVSGSIHIQNSKNQDGTYRTSVSVTVQQLELLGSKASNGQPSATGTPVSVAPQTPAPQTPYAPPQPQAPAYTPQAPAPQAYAPAPQAPAPAPVAPPQPAPAPTYAPQAQAPQGNFGGGIADEEIPF